MDSRESKEADSIRRRRECESCNKRFTTYERIDEIPYMVVKKDGRREKFERQKVLSGLLRACEKRPVSAAQAGSRSWMRPRHFVVDSPERERTTNRNRRADHEPSEEPSIRSPTFASPAFTATSKMCASSRRSWNSCSTPGEAAKTGKR